MRGIIHRDVKPANLLLTRSGRCKVCDFGLALFDEELDGEGRTKCVGTPYYIAPEVAQGKGATAASDLYGLGCTLFFLLTGRAPFAGTSARELMKAHVTQPLPDLRHWRQDVPDRLVMAIEQACAKNPARRFESTAHFAALMRHVHDSDGQQRQRQVTAPRTRASMAGCADRIRTCRSFPVPGRAMAPGR